MPKLEPPDIELWDDSDPLSDRQLPLGDAVPNDSLTTAGPEEYFRLGQAVPEAKTILEAVSALYSAPTPEAMKMYDTVFSDTLPRPYQGSVIQEGELETIRAEQIQVAPTFRHLPIYVGDPRVLPRFRWLSAAAFTEHPQRESFRNRTGHGRPFPLREMPLQAFLSYLCHLEPIDWTETLVFADDPYEKSVPDPAPARPEIARFKPALNLAELPTLVPEQFIRFTIAYVRMPFEVPKDVPLWVQEVMASYAASLEERYRGDPAGV